jgi:hypothetical protein
MDGIGGIRKGYDPSSIDIDGGTIDNTVIGGTTPAAITGTDITSKNGSIILLDDDIAHGMTGVLATSGFGWITPISGTIGGLDIYGLTDANQAGALRLTGIIGAADPTDTYAALWLRGGKKNGTTWQALGAAETVFKLSNYTTDLLYLLGNGNFGIGTATFGTSAAKVLAMALGTAPTTSPADAAAMWTQDMNSAAGMARLHERTESGVSSPISLMSEVDSAINPRIPSQGVYMTAEAAGSNGIQVADNDNIDFGTGNFTLVWRGSLPDWTPSAIQRFFRKMEGASPYTGYTLYVNTDGTISLSLYKNDTGANYTSTIANSFIDGTAHKIACVVTRETASVAGSVVFYVDGYPLGASIAITAATPVTISNSDPLYVMGNAATRFAGTTYFTSTFNRALTAAEVLDLYRNGINFADKWGSQTSIVTGNDSTFAGASNWANVDLNAYDETTGGVLTATANAAAQYCTLPIANATTVIGKKYRLVYDVASIVSTWTIKDFGGTQTIGTVSANGTGQTIEFTASTTGGLRLVAVGDTSSGAFDNFLLYEIGATLALEPEGITSSLWYDSSSNLLNASYPTTGSSVTRAQGGRSKIPESAVAATATLTQDQVYGGLVNNYGQANDAVVTLPTIGPGMNFDVILGTTVAKYYQITAGTNDKIYLDGAAGADNGYVGIVSAVAGAALSFRAFQTGVGTYDWYCATVSGTWVAG